MPTAFDNQAFVTTLYVGLLGHDPDPGTLSFWSGELNAGASREQVASGIIASQEYSGRQVETLYEALLGRAADLGGLNVFVASLRFQGATPDEVKAALLSSDEFFSNAGSNNASFLNALYQDVLGRPVDPVGAALLPAGASDAATRQLVALFVLRSNEADQLKVANNYRDILGRDPQPAELNFWTDLLMTGTPDQAVTARILASDEYFIDLQGVTAFANPADPIGAGNQFVSATNRFQLTPPAPGQPGTSAPDGGATATRVESPAFGTLFLPLGFNASVPGTTIGLYGPTGFTPTSQAPPGSAGAPGGTNGLGAGVGVAVLNTGVNLNGLGNPGTGTGGNGTGTFPNTGNGSLGPQFGVTGTGANPVGPTSNTGASGSNAPGTPGNTGTGSGGMGGTGAPGNGF